jgi:hypothetical protein
MTDSRAALKTTQHEERREEIKTFRVRSFHVGCGGEWLSQGQGYSDTFGTSWLHRCAKCTAIADFDRRYPDIEHR